MQVLHIPAYYDEDTVEPGATAYQPQVDEDEDLLVAAEGTEANAAAEKERVVDLQKEVPSATHHSADSVTSIEAEPSKRLGIHYFADEDHYSQADLDRWLPVLQNLGINWMVLPAPLDRAIPQGFVDALVAAEIQPIVHFNIPTGGDQKLEDLAPLFRAYASWGVRYAVLFDRPNLRAKWPTMAWTQRDLVDRFLSSFVPLAHAALEAGLTPVFPALEPGGDYWDTAFLRSALESLAASGEGLLLESLALGAYAWTGDRPLTWGAGGPENWPATLPYYTPEGSQDQRGLRVFDWYNAISRAILGRELPILILGAGVKRESGSHPDASVGNRSIKIAETLLLRADADANKVPANVITCNFWLLSAPAESVMATVAWFEPSGEPTEVGREWIDWLSVNSNSKTRVSKAAAGEVAHPFSHYLLLPTEGELPVEALQAFLKETNANVGTSQAEAAQAARVTLAGGMESFADDLIRNLMQAGCTLDHLPLKSA